MNLVNKIVEKEHRMFLAVPADREYSCRADDESFRIHRTSQFVTWSEETLGSYLGDLREAERNEKNLMTLKYARMDNLIPPVSINPLIRQIAAVQKTWQKEVFEEFPKFMSRARPLERNNDGPMGTSFETYLQSELETYSDRTLKLLHRDIQELQESGRNMSKESYEYLVRALGYASLREAESAL